MRKEFLDFHLPTIEEEEINAVVETLRSGWLTTGPKCQQFERAFAQYIGCNHAIAVNSGTAALHLALAAIGLGPGDDVMTTPLTHAATAEVIVQLGARPVFVDCRQDTLNIDPEQIAAKVTRKTRAIVPVHFAGLPCQMAAIVDIARSNGLRVIEDAAHALPARIRLPDGETKMVGTIGDITCFSFYATKTLTTGEGGMMTTDSDPFAERVRRLRLHGIGRDAWDRQNTSENWFYEVLSPGYKYNLSDMAAALGLQQLEKCDRFRARRTQIAEQYLRKLGELQAVNLPRECDAGQHAWHLFVIRLDVDRLTLDRRQFIEQLKRRNIGASVHFMPLHLQPYYRRNYGYREGDYPNAEAVYTGCISLPIYPRMTDQDVNDVVEAVGDIIGKHRR